MSVFLHGCYSYIYISSCGRLFERLVLYIATYIVLTGIFQIHLFTKKTLTKHFKDIGKALLCHVRYHVTKIYFQKWLKFLSIMLFKKYLLCGISHAKPNLLLLLTM